jgi:hypothetical protein
MCFEFAQKECEIVYRSSRDLVICFALLSGKPQRSRSIQKKKKMHRKKYFFRDVLTLNFQQKQLLSLST